MTDKPTTWRLSNDLVELSVLEVGAQLGPVVFDLDGKKLSPMHLAPWSEEPGATHLPMLQNLRGDFFCAPFGANDLLGEEARDHGLTANGGWRQLARSDARLELELEGTVSGATVRKEIRLEPGQPVVYQRTILEGGSGRLPLGHHAMLRAPEGEQLLLAFSSFSWAGTPPRPVESDPSLGRSLLEYPQQFESLDRVALAAGGEVDLSRYPALEASEEILMLTSAPNVHLAWSSAVAAESGWLWFALRPNTVLRSTMLWMSNGGRYYPPFSGRHRRVLGIEEVTSFFHLGHAASLSPNDLNERGVATAVRLSPGFPTVVDYAFGMVAVPRGFGRVNAVHLEGSLLHLSDESDRRVEVAFDPEWLVS